MPTVQETATGATQLASALLGGLTNISYSGTVTFRRYVRMVLPLDGFVFWCRAAIIIQGSSAYNAAVYNSRYFNEATNQVINPEFDAQGSIHVTTQQQQNEDGSPVITSIIFTTKEPIADFENIGPNIMYVGEVEDQGITAFAFDTSYKFYREAGLYHYRGRALFSTMATQLIDSQTQLDMTKLVVSNSLPIWLSLNAIAPVYPSFAVPVNLPPPYITAHIDPSQTIALQAIPTIDRDGNHWQLTHDRVKFTTYGLKNNEALDFQDYIINAARDDSSPFGIMNTPIMQDEKANQTEFQILAQKKTFSLDVSYYQARIQDVSRKLILSAICNISVSDTPV